MSRSTITLLSLMVLTAPCLHGQSQAAGLQAVTLRLTADSTPLPQPRLSDSTAWQRARSGAIIGGAIGAVVGLGLAVAVCSTVDGECRAVGILAFTGAGAAVGTAVGAFIKYEFGRPRETEHRVLGGLQFRF